MSIHEIPVLQRCPPLEKGLLNHKMLSQTWDWFENLTWMTGKPYKKNRISLILKLSITLYYPLLSYIIGHVKTMVSDASVPWFPLETNQETADSHWACVDMEWIPFHQLWRRPTQTSAKRHTHTHNGATFNIGFVVS